MTKRARIASLEKATADCHKLSTPRDDVTVVVDDLQGIKPCPEVTRPHHQNELAVRIRQPTSDSSVHDRTGERAPALRRTLTAIMCEAMAGCCCMTPTGHAGLRGCGLTR